MPTPDDSPNVVLTDRLAELKCKQCGCEIDVAELDPFVMVECPDCGNIETVPARLGSFLLTSLIGRGGMGGVYQAIDESLGRKVAIKVMLRTLGDNKQFVETFKREAQAVAKLNHPNIVQIYSFGQEKGQPYIVMELVAGQRFDKMVDSGQVLDQATVMQIGLDVAEALKAADDIGLQHGDVKPENILLDEKGKAKLVDFGLATFAHQDEPEGVWGTPYYIAPEKVQRKKADGRSDIYSLGATLYHAIAGRPPFEGKTPIEVVKARLERPPPPLHYFRKDVDKQVEAVIGRMLEALPAKRHPTYASLISDMQKLVKTLGPMKKTVGGPVTARITLRKKRSAPITIDAGTAAPSAKQEQASPPTASQARPPTAAHPPVASGTRVFVRKTGGAPSTQSALDKYKTKVTGVNAPTGTGKTVRRSARKTAKGVLWTLLVLLLIGGGTAAGIHFKMKKDRLIDQRRELLALAKERTNAETTFAALHATATNVIGTALRIENSTARITNAVFYVTGEMLAAAPVAAATPHPVAGTNAPPAATNAPPAPPAAEPAVGTAPPATQPATDTPEPEIKVEAKKALALVQTAREIKLSTQGIVDGATETLKKARVAATSESAAGQAKELGKLKTELATRVDEVEVNRKEWDRHYKRIIEIEQAARDERTAKLKAEDEEARLRKEEEDRLRKEEEIKALVASELQLAEAARTTGQPLFRQAKFKEMADTISKQLRDYKTPEGQEAAKVLIDRYTRMEAMRAFFVERLNADKFTWGWIRSAKSKEDILGADEEGIKLQGRKVPWAEVSVKQWFAFMQRYLSGTEVRTRVLGEQNLAAAIFCFEHGNKEAAAIFAAKSREYCPDMETQVKRLVPLE